MCVIPEWNGIDNDATLSFYLEKDGYALSSDQIYIGATSFHPEIDKYGRFTVNRTDNKSPEGVPALIFAKTGAFIYYDPDNKQWKILAKEVPGVRFGVAG